MTPHSPASTDRTNKDVVGTFHREVLGEARLARLETLVAPDYRSHLPVFQASPRLPAGRRALAKRLQSTGAVPNEIKRIIADGDMVYAHLKYPGAPAFAGVDMYRVVENRIVEHWSVRQSKPQSSAAVEEWFRDDPSVELTPGLDREWIKRRVRETIEQLWMPGNAALVPAYYARSYVQHNPDMPGGYQRIVAVVETSIRSYIERTGGPFPVEIHRIGGEGDLVFIHLSIFMAGINRNDGVRSTNVDIFRVNREGLMTEHWDVLQMEVEPVLNPAVLF